MSYEFAGIIGIDPARRGLTLRKLAWMVAERKRVMGELAAWHLAGVGALMPFVNAKLSVQSINPYGGPSETAKKIESVRAFIASQAWAALGQ